MNFDLKRFHIARLVQDLTSVDLVFVALMYTQTNATHLANVKHAFSIVENLVEVFENHISNTNYIGYFFVHDN